MTAVENTMERLQSLPTELASFRREVNGRFDELYAHMRLLHEDLVTRIQRLGEGLDNDQPPRQRRGPKR